MSITYRIYKAEAGMTEANPHATVEQFTAKLKELIA
jgi:hypothetical protein